MNTPLLTITTYPLRPHHQRWTLTLDGRELCSLHGTPPTCRHGVVRVLGRELPGVTIDDVQVVFDEN